MLFSHTDSFKLYLSMSFSAGIVGLYFFRAKSVEAELRLENFLSVALSVVAIISSFDLIRKSMTSAGLRDYLTWDELNVLVFGSFSVIFLSSKQIIEVFKGIQKLPGKTRDLNPTNSSNANVSSKVSSMSQKQLDQPN